MPWRSMIRFSYAIQSFHALISALHVWMLLQGSGVIFNTILAGFNCVAFLSAANWRASIYAHLDRMQRNRDFFRR